MRICARFALDFSSVCARSTGDLHFICASFSDRLRFVCDSFFADLRSIRAQLFPDLRSINLFGWVSRVNAINSHCVRFAPDVSSFCACSIAIYADWSAMHHVRVMFGKTCNFFLSRHLPGHFVQIAVPPKAFFSLTRTSTRTFCPDRSPRICEVWLSGHDSRHCVRIGN